MPVDVEEEFVAIDGIVATGDYGVAVAPSSATGSLGVTWTDHGLTTSAGVTRTQERTATDRFGWQNRKKLRTLVTEASVRFDFVLVQTNEDSVALFHGVPLVAGSLVTDPGREWPLIAFDFDMIDGDNVIREYAPSARVVEVGDQVALAGDGFGWPITVEAEYDSTLGGYTRQWYSEFESPAVATLTTALPTAVAVGGYVHVVGTGLGSVVSGTVGGVAIADFDIISDTELYFLMPAGSAGSAPIILTNAGGASASKAYTRGA